MTTTPTRAFFIVWKWRQLSHGNPFWDEFPVEKNDRGSHDMLFRINEKKGQELEDWFIEHITALTKYQNLHIIILLHSGHGFSHEDAKKLLETLKLAFFKKAAIQCSVFADGNNAIYYNDLSKTGFLDQNGDLMDAKVYNGQFETVLKERDINKSEFELIWTFFDNTWKHYDFQFSKIVYQLWVDITDLLVDINNPHENKKLHFLEYWKNPIIKTQQYKKLLYVKPLKADPKLEKIKLELDRTVYKKLKTFLNKAPLIQFKKEETSIAFAKLMKTLYDIYVAPQNGNYSVSFQYINQQFVTFLNYLEADNFNDFRLPNTLSHD